jgi:hypothetical protein
MHGAIAEVASAAAGEGDLHLSLGRGRRSRERATTMTKEQLNRYPALAAERVDIRLNAERSHPRQCMDHYCSANVAVGLSESRHTTSKHIRRLMKEPQTKH